jgi:hypothetical protein
MPKRSNPFQRLVRLIEEDLVGEGAVEESAMVEGREVDLLVTVETGEMTFRIAVECRDHSRPQPVGWVENLIGKYNGFSTEINKVLAVSSSGFTSGARKRAEKKDCAGIKLLSLEEAESVDWGQFQLLREEVSIIEVTVALTDKIDLDITAPYVPDKLVIERPEVEKLIVDGEETPDALQDFIRSHLSTNLNEILEQEVFPKAQRLAEHPSKWEDGIAHLHFDWDLNGKEVVLLSHNGIRYHLSSVGLHFLFYVTRKTLTLGESIYRDVRVLSDADTLEDSSEVSVAFIDRQDTDGVNIGLTVSTSEDEWTLKLEDMSLETVGIDFVLFTISDEIIEFPEDFGEGDSGLPSYILED